MLEILEKIESKVICIIDDKHYQYLNGKEASKQLSNNFFITSISTQNNQITIKLEQKEKTTNLEWEQEYKKQFGEEPGFF